MSSQVEFIRSEFARFWAARPTVSVSDWCVANLRFDEPGNTGPFSVAGREYVVEPLDNWANDDVTDETLVFGSQTGKTGCIMGGVAWLTVNSPSRVLWVMPGRDLAATFSNTRWGPMLRASAPTAAMIPTGAARHRFKTAEQQLGGSIVGFVGSHSAASLASNPCRVVVLDEVDKFSEGGTREADAVNLAEQRTKRFSNPKRVKTSTPTLLDGLIWQEYLKGDQRRYHVPCPHCGRLVVFGWSPTFTIMPKLGCEAWVRWDSEARRPDGSWDLDRVVQSARAECPHCHGHIREHHKSRMIRAGKWIASARGAPGHQSRHLSSLYALSRETSFGQLARRFLEAKRSLLGLQGFINGDLAEPFEGQDISSERVEVVVSSAESFTDVEFRQMAIDVQASSPRFWWVTRDWRKGGGSRLDRFGSAETWEEIEEIQAARKVEDRHVLVDSGYAAMDVYERCLQHGRWVQITPSTKFWCGWAPLKGREHYMTWADPKTKQRRPWLLSTAPLGRRGVQLGLLEFSGEVLKDMLDRLRRGRASVPWEVTDVADDVYWKHMDAEWRRPILDARTGRTKYLWVKRSSRWPDHLRDCEVMQIAGALFYRALDFGTNNEQVDHAKGTEGTAGSEQADVGSQP